MRQEEDSPLGRPRRWAIALEIAFLGLVAVVASVSLERIETQVRNEAGDSLAAVLDTSHESLQIWSEERQRQVARLANEPGVRELTQSLLELPREEERLLASEELGKLRELVRAHPDRRGAFGVFVIGPDGTSVASLSDENVGVPNLIWKKRPDLFRRALAGETVFVPPLPSDVALRGEEGAVQKGAPTLFFAAPVRDERGAVIAVLTQRRDPKREFSRITEIARLGKSGETYALDDQGRLLTESRFEDSLRAKGILEEGQSSVLNVSIHNPRTGQLTAAARSALAGGRGRRVEGYIDYRGVRVLGAWLWSETLGIGLITEITTDEALAPYFSTRLMMIGGVSVTAAFALLLTFVAVRIQRIGLRALRERESRLRAVLETASEGVITLDGMGVIESANPAAEKMFGYASGELEGTSAERLFDESASELRDDLHPRRQAPSAHGRFSAGQYRGRRKGGETFPMEFGVGSGLIGDQVIFTGIFRDVTERIRRTEELERAKDAAEASSRAKSAFLAAMSHEIRTPMNGIMGMGELLQTTSLDEVQSEYLALIMDSARSLLQIIDDILDFSRIEAGHLELQPRAFSVRDLLDDTLSALGDSAHSKGLELAGWVAPEVAEGVVGDPLRIRQILVNLVGNAIKVTDAGQVVVAVTTLESPQGHPRIVFEVRDTGPGIPEDLQEMIFLPFVQADDSSTRRLGGVGLGLTISSRLVAQMGGELKVESTEGQGSRFWFSLELATASAEEVSSPEAPEAFRGLRGLVVEDSDIGARALEERLRRWHIEPVVAKDAESAMIAWERARDLDRAYRLVLVDASLPGTDGFDLAKALLSQEQPRPAVIVMLSSTDRPADARRCRSLGVDGFVFKPVRRRDLLRTIERSLGVQRAIADTYAPSAPARAKRLLVAEDNRVNQVLVVKLLSRDGHTVSLVSTGREAVEAFREHLSGDSFDAVVMDVQMPEMDGLEATREIRRLEKAWGGHVPIIALTAHAMEEDRQRCLAAGMDAYLAKPIDGEVLRKTLASFD